MDLRFSHLGMAVPDLAAAQDVYERVFGYRSAGGPFDDPVQRVRVLFMERDAALDPRIELVAPLDNDSPVARVLSKGIGAYHTGYDTADLETTLTELRAHGSILIAHPAPAVAFSGRRIAWLYLKTRQLIEVVERQGP